MKQGTVYALAMMVLAALLIVWTTDGAAQAKKKTPPKPESTQQETTPPAATTGASQTKTGNTIKDALIKHRGEKTNLGILSKVEGDYFVVEEDGVSTLYPFSMIASIKLPKIDEGDEDPVRVEIKLQ
jgi:hypothetical protein